MTMSCFACSAAIPCEGRDLYGLLLCQDHLGDLHRRRVRARFVDNLLFAGKLPDGNGTGLGVSRGLLEPGMFRGSLTVATIAIAAIALTKDAWFGGAPVGKK